MKTVEELIPAELRPHIIGLWRFRATVGEPTWCTTFIYCGKFYDTQGCVTIEETLAKALKELQTVKKRRKKKCT